MLDRTKEQVFKTLCNRLSGWNFEDNHFDFYLSDDMIGTVVLEDNQLVIKLDNDNVEILYTNFTGEIDKMHDFFQLSKEEFLQSYSYLTEEEYNNTVEELEKNRLSVLKDLYTQVNLLETNSHAGVEFETHDEKCKFIVQMMFFLSKETLKLSAEEYEEISKVILGE